MSMKFIFLVAFTALFIIAVCCYPEITHEPIAHSSSCKPQLLAVLLISFLEEGRAAAFRFFSRRCCGFEISQFCVDRSLPAIYRVVLISAGEEEGALPAPDTVGCLKLRVTYKTSRSDRSELYSSILKILEWVRWQTRMKQWITS